MKKVMGVIGYALLAILFAMQLLAAMSTPMPKVLIQIGIMVAIGLWVANKLKKHRANKANTED